MSSIFNYLEEKRKQNKFCLLALIDPDKKNDIRLDSIINQINNSSFSAVLVGGSKIEDDKFEERLTFINSKTDLPIILFPGSSNQISPIAQSILYLNLISGRNPKYLIEEQVKGAKTIQKHNIEAIPTGYILLDGGLISSVSSISKTDPLSMENKESILEHVLAGQYMGNKLVYLDCGSGANQSITGTLLSYIRKQVDVPIIVGGGIKSFNEAYSLYQHGASYVVIGNALETNQYIDK